MTSCRSGLSSALTSLPPIHGFTALLHNSLRCRYLCTQDGHQVSLSTPAAAAAASKKGQALTFVQLPHPAVKAGQSCACLVSHLAVSMGLKKNPHNSASRNGSPHSLPKTRPRSSKMSHSSFSRGERVCVTSLSTKVTISLLASSQQSADPRSPQTPKLFIDVTPLFSSLPVARRPIMNSSRSR